MSFTLPDQTDLRHLTATPVILVADDDSAVRLILDLLLKNLGYDVLLAKDGKDAVRLFSANKDRISSVLLDVQMPHLNGVAAMGCIRSLRPDIEVVFTSGMTSKELMEKWAPPHPWRFLPKPFVFDDVSAVFPMVA